MSRRIALIGDSVLDSGIWVSRCERNAAYYLEREHGYEVDDYSTDGNRIVDLRRGTTGAARRAFVWHRKIFGLPDYRDVDLDAIPASDLTVVSLGGNDILHCLKRVRLTASAIARDLERRGVWEQLDAILARLSRRGPLALVVPYMANRRDLVGGALAPLFGRVAAAVVPRYYELAKKHGAAVVDLSLSFNPYDDQMYGCTAIEPSELGAQRIASMIDGCFREFEASPGGLVRAEPSSSSSSYAADLDAHLARCRAMAREPVPVERRAWKALRTLYFQALLIPTSVAHVAYYLAMTHVVDDRQRHRRRIGEE